MCHNGEMLENVYEPKKKTKEEFILDYEESCKSAQYASKIRPMTLEGCVVRISDIIAYIGRDIEDAIVLGKLKREDIPENIRKVLGNNNREIINSIILDIVKNSYGKNSIILSEKVFNAINELKKFNYSKIYNYANTSKELAYYKESINKLYYALLDDLENNKKKSVIYKSFLNNMSDKYIENTDNKKIVIDFIAGMTDDYFMDQINNLSVNNN
jgi:dGTPase